MISLATGEVQTFSALLDEGCSYLLPGAFPHGSDIKESACNVETQVQSLGPEDPLEKEMATHSPILA